MPWFPDFTSAVELARRQTQAAGHANPVAQYFAALNRGDTHLLETVWPGEVVSAHGSAAHVADPVAFSQGWYDLSVTISGDSSWSRRYVGHLEDGKASIGG